MQVSHMDEPARSKVKHRFNHQECNPLTSAIASPIWTNLSTNPMTVLKLSEDAVVETVDITTPTVSMPDGVDIPEEPAAVWTNVSRVAWSRSGLIAEIFVDGTVRPTDCVLASVSCAPEDGTSDDSVGEGVQTTTILPPIGFEDGAGDKRSKLGGSNVSER